MNDIINNLQTYRTKFKSNKKNVVTAKCLYGVDIEKVVVDNRKHDKYENTFLFDLKDMGVTQQNNGGFCWIFAGLNIIRYHIIQKHNLDPKFELSQAYMSFWDKFSRADYFLEKVLETSKLSETDRVIEHLFKEPISDGGQWEMFVNLVTNFGVIPKDLYDDNYSASNSRTVNLVINSQLRKFGYTLRQLKIINTTESKLKTYKIKMLETIYNMLSISYGGSPPLPSDNLDWEIYLDSYNKEKNSENCEKDTSTDMTNNNAFFCQNFENNCPTPPENKFIKIIKNNNFCKNKGKKIHDNTYKRDIFRVENFTPIDFYRNITNIDLDEYIAIINDQRPTNPYNKVYSIKHLGNVVGGKEIRYLNLEIDKLSYYAALSLANGIPVWFGADVSNFIDNKINVLDDNSFAFDALFDLEIGQMDKGLRTIYGCESMNHAMVISGVGIGKDKKITKWKVINSWGDVGLKKGIYTMSNDFFLNHVYQVIIRKDIVKPENLDAYNTGKVKYLSLWDPLGTLAKL